MTALTAGAPDRAGTVRRLPALRASASVARSHVAAWAWFWAMLALVTVLVGSAMLRAGELDASVWNILGVAPRWFGFSMLLFFVLGGVGPFVAHGMTRRAFAASAAAATGVTAVGATAVWTLGHAVETAVFRARGWSTATEEPHLYTDGSQLGLVALEGLVALALYGASGALVAATYYRAGAWATLALPLTVGPVVVAEGLAGMGWQGTVVNELGLGAAPDPVRVLLPVAVAAVLLAATHLVLRRAAIRVPAA